MAWNNLGWILYDQRQKYKDAEKCYKKALKWDKKNFFAWNNWGILHYRQKKNYKKAQQCWEKAIELNPEFQKAWNNLSVLYKFQVQNQEKVREYEEKAAHLKINSSRNTSLSPKENTRCIECGYSLEQTQKICDICGLAR